MPIQFNPNIPVQETQKSDSTTNKTHTQTRHPSNSIRMATLLKRTTTAVYTPSGDTRFSTADSGSLLDAYRQSRIEIESQISAFMEHQATKTSEAVKGLADLDDFKGPKGDSYADMAEYWNKENTAQRIFTIAMMGYENGMNKAEFAEKAASIVRQAYGDVGATMTAGFPQVVLDTKQSVFDAIDQFATGTEMSKVTF